MLKKLISALFLAAIMASCSEAPIDKTFVFSAIPDQDETRLRERFDQVATYLSEQLGVPVQYVPVKSYAAAVTAFSNDQVQLAWFGGLSGVQAREKVIDARAIAQGVEDQQFQTYFIANTSTGIQPGEQLPASIQGKTFTFGSKGSTSGRLMPEFYLREQFGKAPDEVFSRVGFSGNHSRTISLVEGGAYQLGATNFKVWENAVATGKVDTDKVKLIWKTPSYPDYQWTIRGDVDQVWGAGFSDKVTAALLAIKDEKLLKAFPRSGFIPASNADYAPIKATAKSIGLMD